MSYESKIRLKNRGVTLFEILLYIGLFSIICFGTIPAYISILKTVDSMQTRIQKNEIQYMFYEILRHNFDTKGEKSGAPGVTVMQSSESLKRILKFYPKFLLKSVSYEMYETTSVEAYHNGATNQYQKIIKVTYILKNVAQVSIPREYTQTLFIYLI